MRKDKKLKSFLAFINITKAFDVLNRDLMFITLWERGIRGKTWRILRNLYKNTRCKVIFGRFSTDMFEIDSGVKQGCILSPTLFSVVMSDLTEFLRKSKCGFPFENDIIPCLLYADDIVLTAENENQLEKMLGITNQFGVKWGFQFSEKKSKVLIVGKRVNKTKLWKMRHLNLPEVYDYKYLGVYFSRSLSDRCHMQVVKKKVKKKE